MGGVLMNPWLCNLLFNNSGGSSLPVIGQTFYASLKTSLVPEVGTSAPTWSRATAAWRFNDQGYLRQIPSGCAEFGGARLVQNNINTKSEDFTNAAWTKSSMTVASIADTPPIGVSAAFSSIPLAATAQHYIANTGSVYPIGSTVVFRVYAKSFGYSFIRVYGPSANCYFNVSSGIVGTSAGANFVSASITNAGNGWYLCNVKAVVTSATVPSFELHTSPTETASYLADGISGCKFAGFSYTNVTGYDASYVPEYVSVGVLSAPYHGAGADGCKYFATDWQGAPIPVANLTRLRKETAGTNALMWSRDFAGATSAELSGSATTKAWIPSVTGSTLVTNGTFDTDLTGWTNTGSSSASVVSGAMRLDSTAGGGGRYQVISLTIGKTYLLTADVTLISGSGSVSVLVYTDSSSTTALKYNLFSASGSANIIFKATSASHRIYMSCNATGRVVDIDNVVMKEVTCVPERTATGLDGIANTATTLTATASNVIILQPTSGIASAARCASAHVKRISGTGTISFTQDGGSTWTDITPNINSATYSRVQITATLANPSIGVIRLALHTFWQSRLCIPEVRSAVRPTGFCSLRRTPALRPMTARIPRMGQQGRQEQ
jgi:hypothetical protein